MSLVRALCLMTCLRLSIRTRLELPIDETWRVTAMTAPLLLTLPRRPRTLVLALTLMVEAALLTTRTDGLLVSVWVSDRCRPRLLDRFMLCLFMMALQFRGTDSTKPLVLVTRVTPWTHWLLSLVSVLKLTPLLTALENRKALRVMTYIRECKAVSG